MVTGYRCGSIGDYSGGDAREASIAWKALNYEYRELGNTGTRNDVARFLQIPESTSWPKVLAEFRKRYGDVHGIWLSRNRQEAKMYEEYGEPVPVEYDKKNMIIDLGGDGIYVIQPDGPEQGAYEFSASDIWQPVCLACGKPITDLGVEIERRGTGLGSLYYHKNCHRKPQRPKQSARKPKGGPLMDSGISEIR